uniref:Isomerase prhC n=2 Tax=Penicillium brasilianum TaxID=104259 RepID=PRHC_PENBI|nr:RecName: Full=Isomerase prhC; AltName: Full=Paraherquonin biosynthesis cluster protein C [Penicillium brasilianum]BAV69304.1 PrhC [Penicillium brasilianum]
MASNSTREKLIALAHKFCSIISSGDMEAVLALRTESCLTYQCCPSFSTRPLNNQETREYFEEWKHIGWNSKFWIIDEGTMVVDEAAKKIAFRAACSADTIGGPYENENLVILQATDDCALVDGIWEFFDAVRKQDLMNRLAAKQAAKGLDSWCANTHSGDDKGVPANNESKVAA